VLQVCIFNKRYYCFIYFIVCWRPVAVQDFAELAHVDACSDELKFLFRRASMLTRLRLADSTFTACEWSDEAIEISNSDKLIQVVLPCLLCCLPSHALFHIRICMETE